MEEIVVPPIRNRCWRECLAWLTGMLSNTLRTLEEDGLVTRTVYPEVPIRVEYELTDVGSTLVPIISQLTEWAQQHMKSIMDSRRQYSD